MREEYNFDKGKRGAVAKQSGKTRITIFLDDEIIRAFRELAETQGTGYQSEINQALKYSLRDDTKPITLNVLRQVLREELKCA